MRKALLAAAIAALVVVLYAAAGYWLAPRFVRDALVEQADRRGLELRLGKVRTDPFAFTVALDAIEVFDAEGRLLAAARSASADLAWASLWRDAWIVQEAWVREPRVGLVRDAQGKLNWPIAQARNRASSEEKAAGLTVKQLAVSEGSVRFVDHSRGGEPLELELQALGLDVNGLSTHAADPAHYTLDARVAHGGALSSRGSFSLQPLGAQGDLAMAGVSISRAWQLAAPAAQAGQGRLQASASYIFDGERLLLKDVSLEGTAFSYAGIELQQLSLQAPQLALPPREPFALSANATAGDGGEVSARGTLGLQPFSADLQLGLKDIALSQAKRWLPQNAQLDITSGALSARGRLLFRESFSYEGALSVRDARFEEAGSGRLLLAWQRLETEEAKLRFSPFGAEIGEAVAQTPSGRLVIEEDGRINFAEVFGKDGRDEGGKPLRVAVRRLRIEDGILDFADRSLDNDFAVTIRELSGGITGFSTEPGNPARVQLTGRVQQYGAARIRGSVNLDQPKSLTNIAATFKNIPLAELTPYIVKFAGYRVESGRVSAELRYRVRDARLVGRNELTFEQLRLGEKVEHASVRDLPLELAVALLADAQGRIALDIPVRGNLDDPQFNFGGLIARALGNVIGKIVSAPFRFLAGVFGQRGEGLGEVVFEPGSVALTPPAEENVAQVAKALAGRPRLGVSVHGAYDPRADVAALRRDGAQRLIARRAGYEGKAPLDMRDPKVLHAAENLYLDRVGSRLELLKLRDAAPRYARALVEQLAATIPVEPGSAETLARARAETVRAALLQHGVEPSRVRLEGTAAEKAGDEGVPTELSLHSDLPAQQQAQLTPAPQADEAIVRRVQQSLNAAGFEAGPVDGVVGPRTEDGLARFQQARGLQATGELDARTLAALGLSGEAAAGATAR